MNFTKYSSFFRIIFVLSLVSYSNLLWSGSLIPLYPGERADGHCLTQKFYAGKKDSQFASEMAEAIEYTSNSLKSAFAQKYSFTPSMLVGFLKTIAEKRALIARREKARCAELYGLMLPTAQSQMYDFCKIVGCYIFSFASFHITDVIGSFSNPENSELIAPDDFIPYFEGSRHSFLFGRADRLMSLPYKRPFTQLRQVDKQTKDGETATFICAVHPSLSQMVALRDNAYQRFSDLLNKRDKLSEAEKINEIGKIYFLLMHAQPFYRGTPAIVESMIDAYFRADLKKKLPQKIAEPFWNVILFDATKGVFQGEDFLSAYAN